MAEPEYILVATVTDGAKEGDLRVKAIANLASGDYILASTEPDQAKEADLVILPYDSIGAAGAPAYAIGSTVADQSKEGDLRVIEMPEVGGGGGWANWTPAAYWSDTTCWTGTKWCSTHN